MTTTTASPVALRAVAAYGGVDRWRAADTVEATFDCGGLLLRWKRRGSNYQQIRVRAKVSEPHVRMEPLDAEGTVAILDGHDVRLERPDGTPLMERPSAREYFPYGRRLLRWDAVDFAYFIGYAMWNYLTFPALLLREDIAWRSIGEHALESRFPRYLPTHGTPQQHYFDADSGRLHEYDYVAEIYGHWAKAAHLIAEHAVSEDGLLYPSKRRVKPRKPPDGPGALRGPLMMWADIRDYRVT